MNGHTHQAIFTNYKLQIINHTYFTALPPCIMKLSNVTPRILANAKRTSCAGHSKRKGLKQERRAITDTLRSELSDPIPLHC